MCIGLVSNYETCPYHECPICGKETAYSCRRCDDCLDEYLDNKHDEDEGE